MTCKVLVIFINPLTTAFHLLKSSCQKTSLISNESKIKEPTICICEDMCKANCFYSLKKSQHVNKTTLGEFSIRRDIGIKR